MMRTALLILSGNASAAVLLLARNLVLARLIPVADYGIAATFAMVMAVIEMASNLGLHQQIVQARRGDDPDFQAALQGFQLIRGVIGALALLAMAGPVAAFLGIPQAASAYRWLALVPLLNAMQHFDIHRAQRRGRYGPMLLTGALPALGSLLVIFPLAHLFGDWRVMLWALLLQAVLGVVTSHLVAERRWHLRFDPAVMADSWRFGAPLLVNAVLLYLVFQGDKLIVGRLSGMEALALYAMGVTLTLTPTLVIAKTTQNIFLPKLSALHGEGQDAAHREMARATLEAALMNGTALVLGMFLLGGPMVMWLLGAKYAMIVPLLVPFAISHALRVFKSGPAIVALSAGATGNALWGNLPRVLVLPIGWWLLQSTGSLQALIWLGVGAELIGFVLSLVRLHSVTRLPDMLPALATSALALTSIGALTLFVPMQSTAIKWLIVLALFGLQWVAMRGLRGYFGSKLLGEA
ncbi:oligosaccharide flippase family protein [Thioclava sp.]|uniref:oligosaccharide flippase family protein n=1 Tax=Thioclava sp. TaxID=1933450 RepID=UPI003AA9670E